MKRLLAAVPVLALCMGLLTGCGSSYDAQESTVYVLKNGKIVSVDVSDFEGASYDEEGLEAYVDGIISEYTAEYGKGLVKLKDISVTDGKASLVMEYASAEDYTGFNGVELFTGSVAEALAAGYGFAAEFADVTGDTPVSAASSDFITGDGYKVVIIRANTNVSVKGTICYVSTENVSLVDDSTVAIADGNSLLGGTLLADDTQAMEAEGTEAAETMHVETEDGDAGSVSEDEILTGEDEDTQIVFDFGDEESADSDASEYSSIYTYIIYK